MFDELKKLHDDVEKKEAALAKAKERLQATQDSLLDRQDEAKELLGVYGSRSSGRVRRPGIREAVEDLAEAYAQARPDQEVGIKLSEWL